MTVIGPEQIKIGDLAVRHGLVNSDQVFECLDIQRRHGSDGIHSRIGELLVKKGYVGKDRMRALLNEQRRLSGEALRIGSYRIIRQIGKGGMGTVYLAQRDGDRTQVALKLLAKKLASDESFLARFRREAQVMLAFNHPHIVRAFEIGEARGYHFLAMEYVEGDSLYQRIRKDGHVEEYEALRICRQVAEAMQYAASRGVVHRDIKPENILLEGSGEVKVADLGLAIIAHNTDQRLTQTGVAIGTPMYIAPEQARGDKVLDIRCDIYALGATLYHAVTGQPPFDGRSAAVLIAKHLTHEVPDPRHVRPGLSAATAYIVAKAMRKKREDRYQMPAEMLADITRAMEGIDWLRRPSQPPGIPSRPPASGAPASPAPAAPLPATREPSAIVGTPVPVPAIHRAERLPAELGPIRIVGRPPAPRPLRGERTIVHRRIYLPPDPASAGRGPRRRGRRENPDSLAALVSAMLVIAVLVVAAIWLGLIHIPSWGNRPAQVPGVHGRPAPKSAGRSSSRRPSRRSRGRRRPDRVNASIRGKTPRSKPAARSTKTARPPVLERMVLQNSGPNGEREEWIEVAQICGGGRLSGGATHANTINPGVRWGNKIGWLSGRRRILVRVPALDADWPAELKIRGAVLEMACYEAAGMETAPITAHPLRRDWQEGNVTWNRRSVSERSPWHTAGAGGPHDRAAQVAAAVQLSGSVRRGSPVLWLSWDITDLALAWVSGESPNHGIVLLSKAAEQLGAENPRARFLVRLHPNTHTAHNADPALHPRLVLTVERR